MGGEEWRSVVIAFVVCLLMVFVTGLGVGASSAPPQADAGLDQTVDQHATVYLDAGGSTAPDGDIVAYEWVIDGPDGTTFEPECPACQQPRFTPEEPGTYDVTVTVTDSNGQTASDTLYVDVHAREPPGLTVSGESDASPGQHVSYELNATPGTHPLLSVSWYTNDALQSSDFLEAKSAWETTTQFPLPGIYTVRADVTDESGLTVSGGQEVTVGEEYSHFAVSITDTNAPVESGEALTVSAMVENEGSLPDTQPLVLKNPDDTVVATHDNLTLEPDEREEITLEWDTCEPFADDVSVSSQDDTDSTLVEVLENDCTDGGYLAIETLDAPDEALEGQTVTVDVTATNTGSESTTQHLTLQDIYDRYTAGGIETVSLEAGVSQDVTLHWATEPGEAGTGNLTVSSEDDRKRTSFELLEAPYFEVVFDGIRTPTDLGSDDLEADVRVTNTGGSADEQDIVFEGLGAELDSETVALDADESETITLEWSGAVGEAGDHDLTVQSDDTVDEATVGIEAREDDDDDDGGGSGGGGGGGGSGGGSGGSGGHTHIMVDSYPSGISHDGVTSLSPGDSTTMSASTVEHTIEGTPGVTVTYSGTIFHEENFPDYPVVEQWTEPADSSNTALLTGPTYAKPDELDELHIASGEYRILLEESGLKSDGDSGEFWARITGVGDTSSAGYEQDGSSRKVADISYEIPSKDDDGGGGDDDDGGGGGDDDDDPPSSCNVDDPAEFLEDECLPEYEGAEKDDDGCWECNRPADDDDDDDGGGGGGGGGGAPGFELPVALVALVIGLLLTGRFDYRTPEK